MSGIFELNPEEINSVGGANDTSASQIALTILQGAAAGAAVGAVFGPQGAFIASAAAAGIAAASVFPTGPTGPSGGTPLWMPQHDPFSDRQP